MHDTSSHFSRSHVSLRGAIGLCLAVAALLVAIPVGVRAAGSLVTIASPTGTHKANVDANGRLTVAVGGKAVKVTSPDDPGRHAFQKNANIQFGQSANVVVPAGKRLVIRSISGEFFLPDASQRVIDVFVTTTVNGVQVIHFFTPDAPVDDGALFISVLNAETTIYADAGTQVQLTPHRTSNAGLANATLAISGYLIDCKPGCH